MSIALQSVLQATDVAPVVGALAAAVATVAAWAVSSLTRHRPDGVKVPTGEEISARIKTEIAAAKPGTPIPFEIEQLAAYYSLTLGQARISFWFSLTFASIGFMVIVGAAALYTTDGGVTSATIKIISGLIIDAVSALFFVQSRRAQQAMSAFFEKLRNDRQSAEARRICEELTDPANKDHVKTILVLQYSNLDPKPLLEALSSRFADLQLARGPVGSRESEALAEPMQKS